jgi:hypothetical protein
MSLGSDSFAYSSSQAEKEKRERFLQRERFLNLKHLPSMMNPEETAMFLGVTPHDIPILVAHKLLTPLGNPVQSAVKYFAKVVLEELDKDVEWLHRARATLYGHWAMKNARKSGNGEFSSLPEKARASSRHSTAARAPSR